MMYVATLSIDTRHVADNSCQPSFEIIFFENLEVIIVSSTPIEKEDTIHASSLEIALVRSLIQ